MKRTDYYSLMERRIRRILMISSSYDAYILEEDGQIEAQLYREYIDLNISNPPALTWVNTTQEAIDLLEKDPGYDLIIDMFNVRDAAIFDQARHIRERWPGIPIVILTNFSRELLKKIASADQSAIDYIFTWNGNADLILAIVKLLEDRMNADADILSSGVQAILLVEDSIRYYSTYLPAIYKLVLKQSAEFLKEALNEQQLKLRKRARPKILLATNYDEAMELYTKYRKNLLGVISDVGFVMHRGDGPEKERIDAGIELCRHIKRDIPQMPVILQSSQGSVADTAREMGVGFIEKYSSTLLIQLSEYISQGQGPQGNAGPYLCDTGQGTGFLLLEKPSVQVDVFQGPFYLRTQTAQGQPFRLLQSRGCQAVYYQTDQGLPHTRRAGDYRLVRQGQLYPLHTFRKNG